jgi:hypothetical protein
VVGNVEKAGVAISTAGGGGRICLGAAGGEAGVETGAEAGLGELSNLHVTRPLVLGGKLFGWNGVGAAGAGSAESDG